MAAMKTVTRYSPTRVDEFGVRYVLDQFLSERSAFDTIEEAQAWIDGYVAYVRMYLPLDESNGPAAVNSLDVRPVECGENRAPLKWRA